MRPISVFFPYLPTAFHRKRDVARVKLGQIFSKVCLMWVFNWVVGGWQRVSVCWQQQSQASRTHTRFQG
jgi:hypothetical protein